MAFTLRTILISSILLHLAPLLLAARTLTQSDLQAIRNASRVTALPGQPTVSFAQYSGYITVEEKHGRALFYWFIEAETSPESKPLALWLNGGPGCSSIGLGAAEEIGPFHVVANGTALYLNEFSWNKEANILFLDSPVGVGFSYSNDSSDIYNFGDKLTAQESYIFLTKWLELFPEYKSRDFYLIGESYAGHYVPQLGNLIFKHNNESSKYPIISLKGFMVGNPITNNFYDWVGIIDYAWSHAVISDELYANVKTLCNFHLHFSKWTNRCIETVKEVFDEYALINIYDLYAPICLNHSTKSSSQVMNTSFNYNKLAFMHTFYKVANHDPCIDNHTTKYFNMHDVQRAMHANTTNIPYKWSTCNTQYLHTWKDSQFSILPIYKHFIQAGLRIWVYSGDVDGRVPTISTRYTLSALKLPIKKQWAAWYHNHQVAGWTQEYEGLTYATVRGAGHDVPQTSPSKALRLFASFLTGSPLPSTRYP